MAQETVRGDMLTAPRTPHNALHRWAPLAAPGRLRNPPALADLAAMASLAILAAALRWPDYLLVPAFTDEALDITRSALYAHGQLDVPRNYSPYVGSLFNYVVGWLFIVFGPHVFLPRLLVVVLGSLTVPAVFLLGRAWGGRAVGLIAAVLVAVNPLHVLVNSRIAYSHSVTPLLTTLGLWQLTRAARQPSGPALAASGAIFGLALLTHPGTLALLPACAVYVAWKAPGLLRTRWAPISAVLFLLGFSPLWIDMLSTGFEPIRAAQNSRSMARGSGPFGPSDFFDNLGDYSLLLLRSTASLLDGRPSMASFLLDPWLLLWAALGPVGAIGLARRGNLLPLLLLPSSLLTSAFFSLNDFAPFPNGRFVMPTVLAVYVAAAWLLVGLARRLIRPTGIRTAALALATVCLASQPLIVLAGFQDRRPVDNRGLLNALAVVEASLEPGETVIVDRKLNERRVGIGVRLHDILKMLYTIRGVPFRTTVVEPDDVREMLARRPSRLIVLDGDSVPRLRDRFSLTRLAPLDARSAAAQPEHAVYRVAPRG